MIQRLWRLIVIRMDWVSMSLCLHICMNVYGVLYTCICGVFVSVSLFVCVCIRILCIYMHVWCVCVHACVRVCVCVQLKFSVTDASIQSFYLQEIPHQLEVHTGTLYYNQCINCVHATHSILRCM